MKSTKSTTPKKGLQLSVAAFLFLIAVMLFSCQKENSPATTPVNDEEAATISQENVEAEGEFEEISEIGFSADADLEASANGETEISGSPNDGGIGVGARVYENLSFRLGSCVKITVTPDDNTFPKTVVIDFGDGCVCRDGKFRKGAIVLHYTGPLRRPGSVLTINLRNYYVNRAHIQGTKTIKNLSEGGVHKYAVAVTDGAVTWPNGRGFKYEKVKVVTQVRGMETRRVGDDVYSIEGRSKTSYANGTTVVLNTETPLIKPVDCKWIVKGILKIKINERTLFLNFGNGDCDNKAILSWGDHRREITLP